MPTQKTLPLNFLTSERVSEHFMLLDYLFDAHNSYRTGNEVTDLFPIVTDERMVEVTHLANTLLEPLVRVFGPCSPSAGFAPYAGHRTPHTFQRSVGGALDLAFHRWVMPTFDNPEGKAPALMLEVIKRENIKFKRLIAYAGTEFMCIAASSMGNDSKVYENIRTWTYDISQPSSQIPKPLFLTHSQNQSEWRLFSHLRDQRKGWRRVEGEPVYHTGRSIRVQHIRTGRFFVLMDFIRSPLGISRLIRNIPPVTPCYQIQVARMASEILDPLVESLGRVTITRGLEGRSVSDAWADDRAPMHRWNGMGTHRVEFVTAKGRDISQVEALLDHEAIEYVEVCPNFAGENLYGVVFNSFQPRIIHSSAMKE